MYSVRRGAVLPSPLRRRYETGRCCSPQSSPPRSSPQSSPPRSSPLEGGAVLPSPLRPGPPPSSLRLGPFHSPPVFASSTTTHRGPIRPTPARRPSAAPCVRSGRCFPPPCLGSPFSHPPPRTPRPECRRGRRRPSGSRPSPLSQTKADPRGDAGVRTRPVVPLPPRARRTGRDTGRERDGTSACSG